METKLFIIGGPTGSGESTLTEALLKILPAKKLITATTREKRLNEKDGRDYFFFSKERFFKELRQGNILEHTYIKNRDTYYGTYRPELEKSLSAGDIVLANTDIVGAKFFKKHYKAITIFISPGSLEVLVNRLKKRDPSISDEELQHRLENARQEIENEQPFYDFVVENPDGKLEEAIQEVFRIIKSFSAQ